MTKVLEQPIVVTRVWRAEFLRVLFFIVTAVLSPIASSYVPASVVTGRLFTIGDSVFWLRLPLFWLVPASVLILTIVRMYNCRYTIDQDGVESREGILSFRQSITRFRHMDIRSIEVDQSLLGRILDVGAIEIGTAATGDIEARLDGVGSPKKLQLVLQGLRESRLRIDETSELSHQAEQERLVGGTV